MTRRVAIALVPALVVFLAVLAVLFTAGIGAGMRWDRWAPPDVIGIGWPIGFPLYAALVALPVFLVALGLQWVVARVRGVPR